MFAVGVKAQNCCTNLQTIKSGQAHAYATKYCAKPEKWWSGCPLADSGFISIQILANSRIQVWLAAKVLHGKRDSNRASGVAQGPPSVFKFCGAQYYCKRPLKRCGRPGEDYWDLHGIGLSFGERASCIQTFIGAGANNITLSGFQPPDEFPHRSEHQADHFLPCCFCWRPRLQDPARSVAPPVCAGLPRSMLPAEHYSEAPRKN